MGNMEPQLSFAFEARVDIGPSEHVGHGPDMLDFTPITGGRSTVPGCAATSYPAGGLVGATWPNRLRTRCPLPDPL